MVYYIDNHYLEAERTHEAGDWWIYGPGYIDMKKEYVNKLKVKIRKGIVSQPTNLPPTVAKTIDRYVSQVKEHPKVVDKLLTHDSKYYESPDDMMWFVKVEGGKAIFIPS